MASTALYDGVSLMQGDSLDMNITDTIAVTSGSGGFDWTSYWVEMRLHPVYQAYLFLTRNFLYILSAIGVPCNALSFLILKRITPLTSAILIMMILTVVDSLRLIVTLLYHCKAYFLRNLTILNFGCSLLSTVDYLLQYITMWLVLLLTLERVVAVCFPMKVAAFCTVSNARRSVIGLFILDAMFCIVHMFTHEEIKEQYYICRFKPKYRALMEKWLLLDTAVYVIIPLILLCVWNIAIIVKLKLSSSLENLTDDSAGSEGSRNQNRAVTVMLLAVSITTIICLAPNAIIVFAGGDAWLFSLTGDVSAVALKRLGISIIFFLTYANNAVNFFLYVISGKRFRTILLQMISSWCCIYSRPIRNILTS